MKRALIFPTVVVWCVVFAIALRMAVADWLWLRRKRRPKPDTDYGLDDDATVTTFIGVLHGEEPSPLGEQPSSRLRAPGFLPMPTRVTRTGGLFDVEFSPAVPELGETTEPMLPTGVHGYRIGTRPVEPVLIRTGEHRVLDQATPIFDALQLPVLDVDVTCDWDRALVELDELVAA